MKHWSKTHPKDPLSSRVPKSKSSSLEHRFKEPNLLVLIVGFEKILLDRNSLGARRPLQQAASNYSE
jgi:hypothetical protein